ncbi:MAG TPA: (2Fe-2S)-binding protein [Acidimicrobiales bacterium]|nr:(2Fe-2S)-binding protein [Acidimicrobiales bacterium]
MVCHCRSVSDRAICGAIDAGATDVESVGFHCGAATRCGGCRPTVEALLAENRQVEIRTPVGA